MKGEAELQMPGSPPLSGVQGELIHMANGSKLESVSPSATTNKNHTGGAKPSFNAFILFFFFFNLMYLCVGKRENTSRGWVAGRG